MVSAPHACTLSFGPGVIVLAPALCSPVALYSEGLLWLHMVQHLLLTQVAAPLLIMSAPVALALRARSPAARARIAMVLAPGPVASGGGVALVRRRHVGLSLLLFLRPGARDPSWSTLYALLLGGPRSTMAPPRRWSASASGPHERATPSECA